MCHKYKIMGFFFFLMYFPLFFECFFKLSRAPANGVNITYPRQGNQKPRHQRM